MLLRVISLDTRKKYFDKQYRPRCDVTECGITSDSTMLRKTSSFGAKM